MYYSTGDPFYSDCSDYDVSITLDSKFIVASTGKRQAVTQTGTKTTHNYVIENARSFAMVLSEKFESVTDSSTGVEINYYFYNDENPKTSLNFAVQSMKLFKEQIKIKQITIAKILENDLFILSPFIAFVFNNLH